MKKNFLKHALFFTAALSVGGCATSGGKTSAIGVSASDSPVGIGGTSIGDLVSITASEKYDASSVVVASEYTAASGRLCRRLQTAEGVGLPRVICKKSVSNWVWARDLGPAGKHLAHKSANSNRPFKHTGINELIEYSNVGDASVDSKTEKTMASELAGKIGLSELKPEEVSGVVEVAGVATSEKVVFPNETLWSFAKRTTGNALNWQRIAELNDIEDSRTIVNGDLLQVPVGLLRDGD